VGFLRYPANIEIGGDVIVKEGVRLCPAQPNALIKIGDNTSVGYHTFAFATTSIVVGNNCLIAPFCYLVDSNHGIRRQALIRDQEMVASPIVIEDDVWLGTGVTVLKGVRIGQGAVIGAGCVIAHDVAAYDVVRAPEPTLVGTRELRT
jgi:acetyltransferase-like isoleucine patch superfamily enzyme